MSRQEFRMTRAPRRVRILSCFFFLRRSPRDSSLLGRNVFADPHELHSNGGGRTGRSARRCNVLKFVDSNLFSTKPLFSANEASKLPG